MTQKQVDLQKLLEMEQARYKEVKKEKQQQQNPLFETMKSLEKELNLDIYSGDEENHAKKRKKYSSTKVKVRNFLTNVSYTGIKKCDYQNRSFVIDIYSFLILYFNPYNLDSKFESEIERDYVNVLWTCFMPESFYNFIFRNENIKVLNKTKVKFQEAVEIVNQFIEDDSSTQEKQFAILKEYLEKYLNMYQFIFCNLFPKYFSKVDDYGIQAKIEFDSCYRNYLYQKQTLEWGKNNQCFVDNKNNETTAGVAEPLLLPSFIKKEEIIEIKDDDATTLKQKEAKEKKLQVKINKRELKKRQLEEKPLENTKRMKQIK